MNLLERRVWQVRQILGLVDEALCLVLKRADLVVDLLEGTRRRQDVLGVVGRVIDDTAETELRVRWRGQHRRCGERYRQDEGRERQRARA